MPHRSRRALVAFACALAALVAVLTPSVAQAGSPPPQCVGYPSDGTYEVAHDQTHTFELGCYSPAGTEWTVTDPEGGGTAGQPTYSASTNKWEVVYDPDGHTGIDTFVMQGTAGGVSGPPHTVKFTVTAPPPPLPCYFADNDPFVVDRNGSYTFSVACDPGVTDPAVVVDQDVEAGAVSVGGFENGVFELEYAPNEGYLGSDQYKFHLVGADGEETAVFTVDFSVQGQRPQCTYDDDGFAETLHMRPNRTQFIPIACDPGSYQSVSGVAATEGTIDLDEDTGWLFFTPGTSTTPRTVEITYTVTSADDLSDTVVQPVQIDPETNHAPVCFTSPFDGDAPHVVEVGRTNTIHAACADPDEDVLRIGGAISGDGNLMAVSHDRVSRDEFGFRIPVTGRAPGSTAAAWFATDGAESSNPFIRAVTVVENDGPQCSRPGTPEGTITGIAGRSQIYEISCDDDVTLTQGTEADHGTIEILDGETFRYSHVAGRQTSDEFTFDATDANGRTVELGFTITLSPLGPPTCTTPSTEVVRPGETVEILLECSNAAGDPLSFALTGPGAARVERDGPTDDTATYTAPASGTTDQFSFTATFQGQTSQAVTQPITIDAARNSAPQCTPDVELEDVFGQFVRQGASRTFGVHCFDADDDLVTITALNDVERGTRGTIGTVEQEVGHPYATLSYSAAQSLAVGTDQFTWRATDGRTPANTRQHVRVRPGGSNHAPALCPRVFRGDRPRSGHTDPVGLSCDDIEGDHVTVEVIEGPQHGTLGDAETDEHGFITVPYTSDAGFSGPDEFQVRFVDALGAVSAPAAVEVDVRPPGENDVPVCEPVSVTAPLGESVEVPAPECHDNEGDPIILVVEQEPGQGTLTDSDGPGRWTYTPGEEAAPEVDDSFTYRAVDEGPEGPTFNTYEVEIDIVEVPVGPEIESLTASPANTPTSQRLRRFIWPAATGAVRYECKVDANPVEACTPSEIGFPVNLAPIAQNEGSHSFSVQAFDADGLGGPVLTSTWVLDTVAPSTGDITGGVTGGKSNAFPNFDTFTGTPASDVAYVECRLTKGTPAGTFGECPHDETFPNLTNGTYTLEVRAVDEAGNADASPSSKTWAVDTVAPVLTIGGTPSTGATNVAKRTLTFSSTANDIVRYRCSFMGQELADADCKAAGTEVTATGEGTKTFVVYAIDDVGNVGQEATASWEYDTTAPTTNALTRGPAARTTATGTEFGALSGRGQPVGFECRALRNGVEVATWSQCADLTDLTDATYRFEARAFDAAGNRDESPSVHEWTVDTTSPATGALSGGPAARTKATTATFSAFSGVPADDVHHFTCRLERGTVLVSEGTCPTDRTFSGLQDGTHTLHVRAVDDLGNDDDTPAIHAWTVDTVAPAAPAVAEPGGTSPTKQAARRFTWTIGAGDGAICKLDGELVEGCDGDLTVTVATQGQHTFSVVAIDDVGNESTASSRSWTFDSVEPTTNAIAGGPEARTKSRGADFDPITGDDDASGVECRLITAQNANPAWGACNDLTGLADGTYTFEARAFDAAGNKDSTPSSRTWAVDNQGPAAVVPTVDDEAARTNKGSRTFTYTRAAGVRYACSLKRPEWTTARTYPCGDAVTTVVHGVDGTYELTVSGFDDLDNEGAAYTRTWIVDRAVPDTTIEQGPIHTSTTRATTAFIKPGNVGRESGVTYACVHTVGNQLPSGRIDCTDGLALDGLAVTQPVTHKVEVFAKDEAGNEDSTPAVRIWTAAPESSIAQSQGDLAKDDTFRTAPADAEPSAEQPVLVALTTPRSADVIVSEQPGVTTEDPPAYGLLDYEVRFESEELDENSAVAGERIRIEFEIAASVLAAGGITESNLASIEVFRNGVRVPACPETPRCAEAPEAIGSGADFKGARVVVLTDALSTWNFGVDDVAPTATIGGHSGEDADGDVTFTYTSSETSSTFSCSLDGGAFTACPSNGKRYTDLADGDHTFAVKARDAAGNVGPAASRSFSVKRPAKVEDKKADDKKAEEKKPELVTPPPVAAPKPPVTARGLAVGLLSSPKQKLAAALRRGVSMALECSSACQVDATLTVPGTVAKRLKLARTARKPVVVARGRASGTGRVALRIAFTAKAKKALRRQRSVRLTLGGTATGNGVAVPLRGALTIKR